VAAGGAGPRGRGGGRGRVLQPADGQDRSLGLHGVAVDKPEQVAAAWDQALAADRPTVLDFRTDPDVPPIPPHATFEQAKDAATALLKGDPNRWGILKEGLMAKAREVMPGKDS
jgi:pyruvate dehydrogenase (quinone)